MGQTRTIATLAVSAVLGWIFATSGPPAAGVPEQQWKAFASSKYHFTVQYPASWYRLGDTSDILDITNFERSGPGDGIATKVAGAEITVTGALPGIKDVDDWIRRDLPDSDDIAASENNVKIAKPAADSCIKLKQASWHEPLSPDAYFAETAYYCTTAAGLYKVSLLNWQDDPKQTELRDLAVKVALSLRTRLHR